MKNFDERVKEELMNEQIDVPEEVHEKIENTLNSLPEKEVKTEKVAKSQFKVVRRRVLAIAASLAFAFLVLMPNVSVTYAQVMSNIPVLGVIVDVFTVRNYNFNGDHYELNAEVPNVAVTDGENQVITDINADIDTFTNNIINKFYEDLASTESSEYGSVNIDYEVVTNNDKWFTLKINVTEVEASGYMYAKYYHINRETGKYVTFNDLFDTTSYVALEEYIIADMKAQMEADEDIVYFFDDPVIGEDIIYVSDDQNFYFDENNNLVMAYNEYEVAPGYMGMPEITIPVEVYEAYLK